MKLLQTAAFDKVATTDDTSIVSSLRDKIIADKLLPV